MALFEPTLLCLLSVLIAKASLSETIPFTQDEHPPEVDVEAQNVAAAAYLLGTRWAWGSLSNLSRSQIKEGASWKDPTSPARTIVVVTGDYDQAETALERLHIPYIATSIGRINRYLKKPCRQIVILNSNDMPIRRKSRRALRRFVRLGGVIIATDLAGRILNATFPEKGLVFRKYSPLDRSRPIDVFPADVPNVEDIYNTSCATAHNVTSPFEQVRKRASL